MNLMKTIWAINAHIVKKNSGVIKISLILMGCDYYHEINDCVSTFYDEKERKLIYYKDKEREVFPYFYTTFQKKTLREILGNEMTKIIRVENEKKFNSIKYEYQNFLKIIVDKPEFVGGEKGLRDFFKPNTWQDREKFYSVYIKEKKWNFGMYYEISDGKPIEKNVEISFDPKFSEVLESLKNEYKNFDIFNFYSKFFNPNYPNIEFFAIDIEIRSGGRFFPDPEIPRFPIVAISFSFPDLSPSKYVLQLEREHMGNKETNIDGIEIRYFKTESALIKEAFNLILSSKQPIVLTFNGDQFDIPYLHNRAKLLKINSPFSIIRGNIKGKNVIMKTKIKGKLHFDLYQWLSNPSVANYIYKGKYEFNDLDTIGKALVNLGKYSSAETAVDHNYIEEAKYCSRDTELLILLFKKVYNIVFALMRLTNTSFEDINRKRINFWHSNFLRRELARRNWIEPNRAELRNVGELQTTSVVGKKFGGALVKAVEGVYTNCTTLDFASLYPTIYKRNNLSFETINCNCCSQETDNKIPGTLHFICKKRIGMIGEIYGFLKDVRVKYFKPMKISDVEQGLKILIVSAYGVFGFSEFDLYCPPLAEGTTAFGREANEKTWKKCESLQLFVMQSDTDSQSIDTQDKNIIDNIINFAKKELYLDLEVDSFIKIFIIYKKKNYVKIKNDGSIETKGMMGKKKNTPLLFKKCFNEIIEMIKKQAII